MTTVAHYVADRLCTSGALHVLLVTGGGAMFLTEYVAVVERTEVGIGATLLTSLRCEGVSVK